MYVYNRKAPPLQKCFLPNTHLFVLENPQPSGIFGSAAVGVGSRPNGEEVLEVSEAAEAGHVCMYIWSPPQDLPKSCF